MLVSLLAALALAPQEPAVPAGAAVRPSAEAVVRTSPSGAWRLATEVADDGRAATSTLTRADGAAGPEAHWSRELDFVWDAVCVTDAGFVAGVAYSGGGRDAWRDSELIVALLAPDGTTLREERVPRRRSHVLGQAADPKTNGVFVHDDLQRFVVRVADEDPSRGRETWWTYAVATGEPLARVHPRDALEGPVHLRAVADAAPIPWTPLTLVQWWSNGRRPGVRFAVLDDAWRAVWSLELPRAYAVLPEERVQLPEVASPDAIRVDRPRGFELLLVGEGQRATFTTVDGDEAQRWVVREERRRAYFAEVVAPRPLPALELEKLDEVTLGGVRLPPETYRIVALTFRGARLELIHEEGPGRYVAVLVSREGAVLERRPLARGRGLVRWFPLDGRRWLGAVAVDPETRFFVADGSTGEVRDAGRARVGEVAGAASLDDGGFAVLTADKPKRGEPYLFGFGPVPWRVERGRKEPMLWPDSLARASTGELCVLDRRGKTVRRFSQAGDPLGEPIELREALRVAHRPSNLTAGPNGTLLVQSLGTLGRLGVVDLHGNVVEELVPEQVAPGRSFGSDVEARLGPGNEIWLCDGSSLYRLAPDGSVRQALWERGRGAPERVGAVLVDFLGRICVQDIESGAVHVFDHRGESLQVCRPAGSDLGLSWASRLAVAPDRSIYVSCVKRRADHLAFAPDGEWLGYARLGALFALFDPVSGRRWLMDRTLRLVDEDDRQVAEIPHLPGGRMLEGVPAVAPDGSLAVVTDRQVALYSADGELEDVFAVALTVAPHLLAYGADGWLVVSEADRANLIRVRDRSVWDFAVDDTPRGRGVAYGFSPDGDELWAVERDRRRLHRYALRSR